ncbi:MAG: M48 family metallopeptidase [Patescibacteria group bacterium]
MFSRPVSPKLRIEKHPWQPGGSLEVREVTLRRSRLSRHVRILISERGEIMVTAPLRTSKRFLLTVLEDKRDWVLAQLDKLARSGQLKKAGDDALQYRKYKEQARRLTHEKLAYWNQFYGFSYGRISIRNQRTRWGSCSLKGNLSFHYKIALLPEPLADYLIVHELCHLKAFDHSPRFWALVAKTMPDYQARRRALHRNSL